ncbi:MAG: HD domain-containing protein [Firmicutes bacterium]|nr:HD domain-containing protein [Bacillota bacterium]
MKEIYLNNINTGDEITDFFMVKAIDVKTGSNNKQYLDLLLSDKTGEITGKKWDITDEEIQKLSAVKTGSLVKIKAQVTEWNGMKQFRVFRIRGAMEQDGLDTSDYVKAAPEDPREMYDFIMGKAQALGDEDLKKLCVSVLQDNEEKLLYYPAAQKNHHAEFAGLLWHMKRMVMNGEGICRVYTILDPDLVTAGVILHDIEKIREIRSNDMGISDGYSMEGMMLGHIVQGVRELDSRMKDLGFSDEKRIMIEHMILSHHYEPEFGSPRKPMFPEAEILHYLDIIDARMFDMEEALDGTKPGEFSDRIWTLDNRKLYKKSE